MLFLPVMDLWIANEPALEQAVPIKPSKETESESVQPVSDDVSNEKTSNESDILDDSSFQIIPYALEGSVESFDPIGRAIDLSSKLPRKWCGTFRSFDTKDRLNVVLNFSKIKPIGQIVSLDGEMMIGKNKAPVLGYLNAKSDQFELFSLSQERITGLSFGGNFMSLQGPSLSAWRSTELQNSGGRLDLSKECGDR